MKVKEFKFKDIKQISNFVTQLELEKEDIQSIVDVLTGAQKNLLTSMSEVENYLINNVPAKERKKLYEKYEEDDFENLRQYALQHKGVDPTADLLDVVLKLFGILSEKFEVVAKFIAYYLEDYTYEQVMELGEEEAADAILAVFTNKGFVKFFSRLFNSN